jgi:hypothetical protein
VQFGADANLDWPIIEQLRAGGHFVTAVVELSPGISNPDVFAIANENGAILLTADKDFGELVNDLPWHESFTGMGQGTWLLSQLCVDRQLGRSNRSTA